MNKNGQYTYEVPLSGLNKDIKLAARSHRYYEAGEKDKMWYIVEEMYQCGQLPCNNWKGEFFNKNNSFKDVKELKSQYSFLKEVDSIALQSSVENLDNAYGRYYKHLGGKPKFKSKKNEIQSYKTKMVNGNI